MKVGDILKRLEYVDRRDKVLELTEVDVIHPDIEETGVRRTEKPPRTLKSKNNSYT